MNARQVGADRSGTSDRTLGRPPAPHPHAVDVDAVDPVDAVDAATFELLRRLLTLPADTARRVRDEAPRRRVRRPQQGPGLDLGARG